MMFSELTLESNRVSIQYLLNECIASLTDLATCLQTDNVLIKKFKNCNQVVTDAFVCMSVLPATRKALARYEAEINEDNSISPETAGQFIHYPRENDDIETRSALAQYEEEENGGVGMLVKRGLGRCIHRCLKGPSGMSFIQCKSMCHR